MTTLPAMISMPACQSRNALAKSPSRTVQVLTWYEQMGDTSLHDRGRGVLKLTKTEDCRATDTFTMRIRPADKVLLEQAANQTRRSLANFVIESSVIRAQQVLQDRMTA